MSTSLILPAIIMTVAMLGLAFWQRKRGAAMSAAMSASMPQFKVGEIAQRFGMRVVKGDPELNLAIPKMGSDVEVVIEGAPYGVPTYMRYLYVTKDSTSLGAAVLLGQSVTNYQYDSRIEVASNASRGRFEIQLAKPHRQFQVVSAFDRDDPLPPRQLGGELDGLLRINADDADVPAMLAPHLAPLLSMGYVHIVGESGRITFDMSRSTVGRAGLGTASAYGFSQVDAIVHVLVSLAAALEGRPAPGALPAAAGPQGPG